VLWEGGGREALKPHGPCPTRSVRAIQRPPAFIGTTVRSMGDMPAY